MTQLRSVVGSPWLRLVPRAFRAAVAGDLAEEHATRLLTSSRPVAYLAFMTMLLRSAVAFRVQSIADRHIIPTSRRMTPANFITDLRQDALFAVRTMTRAPLFASLAIVTLGLGIGAATTMFSVVNGVLLRPLPFDEPDRLVTLMRGDRPGRGAALSMPEIAAIQDQARSLDDVTAWQGWGATLEAADGSRVRRVGASVSGQFFDVLGIEPARGRFFDEIEALPGHAPVVVISHDMWVREYGGTDSAIGAQLQFADESHEIIGVAPEGFIDPLAMLAFGTTPEMWRATPSSFDTGTGRPTWFGFWAAARMRDRIDVGTVNAEVASIADAYWAQQGVSVEDRRQLSAASLRDAIVGDVRATVLGLMTAVALLLVIACANVANLLLSRSSTRMHEVAVRRALGARRARVIAQLGVESLVLAAVATALGLAVAAVALRTLGASAAAWLPATATLVIDARVVAFAVAAVLVTSVLFGLAPALQLSRPDSADVLRSSRGAGSGGARLREVLVAVEAALTVVLLIGAGLLVKSLWRVEDVDPGFSAHGVATARVTLDSTIYPDSPSLDPVVDEILTRAGALPGVVSSGLINTLPLSGAVDSTPIIRADQSLSPEEISAMPYYPVRAVSPDYFSTVRMRLIRGRGFAPTDSADTAPVVVINESLARALFENEEALGRDIVVRGVRAMVIGIVNDVHQFGRTRQGAPALYTAWAQERQGWMRRQFSLVVRVDGDPTATGAALRSAIHEVDARVPLASIGGLHDLLDAEVAAPRFRGTVASAFAATALTLAAIGLAGVVAFNVGQRMREIALRMALGAHGPSVVAMVLAQAVRSVAIGCAAGVAVAYASTGLLADQLFEVEPLDPAVFGLASGVLVAITLLAALIPARRAAAVAPASVLREV